MRNLHDPSEPITVIGLMSGTSLDGVDLACCTFLKRDNEWTYTLHAAETTRYSQEWKVILHSLHLLSGEELASAHASLGKYFAECINRFILSGNLKVQLVGSHGHTVFHQPGKGFTCQIGDAAQIAVLTAIDTIADFRTKDIALGGQGAPLVPIGDRLLFGDRSFCLNLGGIANISFDENNLRKGFDICPANMILNHLSAELGMEYDDEGKVAATGNFIQQLFDELNSLSFYKLNTARSLGREWFTSVFLPVVIKYKEHAIPDLLKTVSEHIAYQVGEVINMNNKKGSVLVTGGGAFNKFLIQRLSTYSKCPLEIPPDELICFKEAVIFAFLAALNYSGEINVLGSATGSGTDHIGGALYRAG